MVPALVLLLLSLACPSRAFEGLSDEEAAAALTIAKRAASLGVDAPALPVPALKGSFSLVQESPQWGGRGSSVRLQTAPAIEEGVEVRYYVSGVPSVVPSEALRYYPSRLVLEIHHDIPLPKGHHFLIHYQSAALLDQMRLTLPPEAAGLTLRARKFLFDIRGEKHRAEACGIVDTPAGRILKVTNTEGGSEIFMEQSDDLETILAVVHGWHGCHGREFPEPVSHH